VPVAVQDSGQGLEPAMLERVFESLYARQHQPVWDSASQAAVRSTRRMAGAFRRAPNSGRSPPFRYPSRRGKYSILIAKPLCRARKLKLTPRSSPLRGQYLRRSCLVLPYTPAPRPIKIEAFERAKAHCRSDV